ncbi:hypothetical protein QFC22_001644 [Naganishia vaughanmartiniae]|uniref:Uncharacterized protein n=1 Tax=Naganishia vaughanmartiniae TaxID=1424756 RepID=A0ACC2XII0_9TREE|nr:hypothetical protein QFC22_001644 [Naganishia vaughanmartiniae]
MCKAQHAPAPPTVNPVDLHRKCRFDNGNDQPPDASVMVPHTNIILDNADLHNTRLSVCSSEDLPLAVYDDSSDDEDDVLNVADIQRYYWSRGDVKFL